MALVLALVCSTNIVRADELIVADGTTTNEMLPIYGYYADTRFTNQFIYPAADLADMADGTIKGVTFHSFLETLTFNGSGQITVKLAEVEQTTLSALLTPDFTTVYVGGFNVADYELPLAFSADYTYNGGNLLVQIELTKTASNYPASSFLGINSDGSGLCKYQTYGSGSVVNFLPKATFSYEAGAPVTCDKPLDIIINDADIEPTGVMLTLAGINNATIEIKRAADTEWTVKETEFNGPSWGIGTLEPNTTYDVRIKNVCGTSWRLCRLD